jgi:DNA (cytosine-5)-methyltransferase 1
MEESMGIQTVELCAGGGGEAIGLEQAGIEHIVLMDNDTYAVQTLRANRPRWDVREADLREFPAEPWKGVDMVSGGLPCPPFSVAGQQLGEADERDLFGVGMEFIGIVRPPAVMLENVKGILDPKFEDYRTRIRRRLNGMGYVVDWRLLNASDYGVSQLRPRVVFVALKSAIASHFRWPAPNPFNPPTVGEVLGEMMGARGWRGVEAWKSRANDIAPTIVGGSKKHGGPDLGPTRARRAWAELGVDGKSIAEEPPGPDFVGMPRLTVQMVARLQGFPDNWRFVGRKTHAYRQVGNAFPPPVARAVAAEIKKAMDAAARSTVRIVA